MLHTCSYREPAEFREAKAVRPSSERMAIPHQVVCLASAILASRRPHMLPCGQMVHTMRHSMQHWPGTLTAGHEKMPLSSSGGSLENTPVGATRVVLVAAVWPSNQAGGASAERASSEKTSMCLMSAGSRKETRKECGRKRALPPSVQSVLRAVWGGGKLSKGAGPMWGGWLCVRVIYGGSGTSCGDVSHSRRPKGLASTEEDFLSLCVPPMALSERRGPCSELRRSRHGHGSRATGQRSAHQPSSGREVERTDSRHPCRAAGERS